MLGPPPPPSLPLKMNKSVVLIKLMEAAKAEKRKKGSPRNPPAAALLESSKLGMLPIGACFPCLERDVVESDQRGLLRIERARITCASQEERRGSMNVKLSSCSPLGPHMDAEL